LDIYVSKHLHKRQRVHSKRYVNKKTFFCAPKILCISRKNIFEFIIAVSRLMCDKCKLAQIGEREEKDVYFWEFSERCFPRID
jgi:hypothetical protein